MGIWVCPQVICSATHPLSLHQCCRGLTSPRYSTRSCVALVETCCCRTTCRRTGRRRASTFAYTAPRVCPRWWLDWWRTSRRRSQASPRTLSTKGESKDLVDPFVVVSFAGHQVLAYLLDNYRLITTTCWHSEFKAGNVCTTSHWQVLVIGEIDGGCDDDDDDTSVGVYDA